jgi:uncharacterized protein YwqG
MTQEITDAMLDEQAEHLTSLFAMAGYGTFTQDPERIYRNVTRTALEVERESLRYLEEAKEALESNDVWGHCAGIAGHINRLRTRLGITE